MSEQMKTPHQERLEQEESTTVTRRGFMQGSAVAGAAVPFLFNTLASTSASAQENNDGISLDLAEWSYFFLGVQGARVARGTICDGSHFYVEYAIPRNLRYPYPVVLLHGGDGQGTDWLTTPDGRPGWATLLLQAGYAVYILDRTGQGRPAYNPTLNGGFPRQAPSFENNLRQVAAVSARHTQWPGEASADDPALQQFVANLGPSMGTSVALHEAWQQKGSILLDEIGPAIIVTHGDSSAFAWLLADARPALVKGIIALEPEGEPFAGPNATPRQVTATAAWGLTAAPMTFAPTLNDPAELERVQRRGQSGRIFLQQTVPARRLVNLANIPVAVVSADASTGLESQAAIVTFLQDAGCDADHLRLADMGITGNGPYMMLERNNQAVLQALTAWLDGSVSTSAAPALYRPSQAAVGWRSDDSTALRLADHGHFWVGVGNKEVPYGTIAEGQMFVQYFIPEEQTKPYPLVLIHGGGGQATHMMGIGRRPGWLHFFVQEGYSVYAVDRPGFGRSPYHPDSLGPSHLNTFPAYEAFATSPAVMNTVRWPGSHIVGEDPLVDQFMANEVGNVSDQVYHSELSIRGAEELIDRTGPVVILSHAFGGYLGWLMADRRPDMVKAIMSVETNGNPFAGSFDWGITAIPMQYDPPVSSPDDFNLVDIPLPPDTAAPLIANYTLQAEPVRQLVNLRNIPIGWLTGEFGGGGNGFAQVEFFRQAGCDAELLRLRDLGIEGNGNLMVMEENNREVFNIVRDWFDRRVR